LWIFEILDERLTETASDPPPVTSAATEVWAMGLKRYFCLASRIDGLSYIMAYKVSVS
jgi:hypothetical protein